MVALFYHRQGPPPMPAPAGSFGRDAVPGGHFSRPGSTPAPGWPIESGAAVYGGRAGPVSWTSGPRVVTSASMSVAEPSKDPRIGNEALARGDSLRKSGDLAGAVEA